MPVRARADYFERFTHRYERLAGERAVNDLDERLGQMREVAQRLVLDGAAFAVAAAQQVGLVL